MRKSLYLVATLATSVYYAQSGNVGINTEQPTESLDVNGTMRVRSLLDGSDNSVYNQVLVMKSDGTFGKVSRAGFSGSGNSSLVKTSIESVGSNCSSGGVKLESGEDTNGNGILDAAEITATRYICNGLQGASGNGFSNGTAGGQIYITDNSAPYAPQIPRTVTGDISLDNTASATITNNAVTSIKIANNAVTTSKINDGAVTLDKLSATGTKSSSTYLRGDGTWATPAGGGGGSPGSAGLGTLVDANNQEIGAIQSVGMNNYLVKTTGGWFITINIDGSISPVQTYYEDGSCSGPMKYINTSGANPSIRNSKYLYHEPKTDKFFKLYNPTNVPYVTPVPATVVAQVGSIQQISGQCSPISGNTSALVGFKVEETESSRSSLGLPAIITPPLSIQ